MLKVMFLCIGNSCRSPMAEGFLREFSQGRFEAHSAGLLPIGLNPRAIAVMKEAGIDISGQRSKAIDPDLLKEMDVVITLCGNADKACPAVPGVSRLHWPIEDPVGTWGTGGRKMEAFRKTREEIKKRVMEFIKK